MSTGVICANCGAARLSASMIFCGQCGSKFEVKEEIETNTIPFRAGDIQSPITYPVWKVRKDLSSVGLPYEKGIINKSAWAPLPILQGILAAQGEAAISFALENPVIGTDLLFHCYSFTAAVNGSLLVDWGKNSWPATEIPSLEKYVDEAYYDPRSLAIGFLQRNADVKNEEVNFTGPSAELIAASISILYIAGLWFGLTRPSTAKTQLESRQAKILNDSNDLLALGLASHDEIARFQQHGLKDLAIETYDEIQLFNSLSTYRAVSKAPESLIEAIEISKANHY